MPKGAPREESAEHLLAQAQAQIRQLTEELEHSARQHQHSEQQLKQQAAALARSNRDLEQFAYAASHDLQGPLRAITGFSQLLMKHSAGKLDARCDEYLQHIESSARHLHLLISDLLEYSRVDRAGRHPDWVEAGDVVREAVRALEAGVREKHGAVLYAGLPKVHADGGLLLHVFQHLLGNALKYSRPDVAPEIRISCEARPREWEFAVRDNGIGIPPEQTERIFTMFERLHLPDEYEGTGIGLSICQKIVERHGGRIWAESEPGKGSTFRFTLVAPEDIATAR